MNSPLFVLGSRGRDAVSGYYIRRYMFSSGMMTQELGR